MAMTRPDLAAKPWAAPRWSSAAPEPSQAAVLYNPLADELVVFFDDRRRGGVVVWIDEPSEDIAVITDDGSGEVIGVQVDNLLFKGVSDHPAWRALAEPEPPLDVVAALVDEARRRFERYGAGETPPRG